MPVSTKQPGSVLTRSAEEVKRYRLYKKIVPPVLGLITLVLVIVYIISILFTKYGSFTVKINNLTDRKYYLTLCESDKFLNPVSYLNSKAVKDVTNIDGNTLPADLNDVDGEHNGENYVAYTFYAKNVGQSTITYDYDLVISRKTIGVDSAIRSFTTTASPRNIPAAATIPTMPSPAPGAAACRRWTRITAP